MAAPVILEVGPHPPEAAVLRLIGTLDREAAAPIRTRLIKTVTTGPSTVILDVHHVPSIDGAGAQTLAYVQRWARQAGGELRLVAPTDQVQDRLAVAGVDNVLNIHATIEDALTAVHHTSRPNDAPRAPGDPMNTTILVVDDDPTIRTLIRRVLTHAGYRVREAEDGLSALEQIAVSRPALILTDLMMPHMKGDALIEQVMQGADPIPCILMSAYHPDVSLGPVPFLPKPFATPDLVRLVSEPLSQPSVGTPTTGLTNVAPVP